MNSIHLRQAVSALRRGGVIAYPTEAVWGLGADPWNQRACMRLLDLKRREWQKGLIVVAADAAQLEPFIDVPSKTVYFKCLASMIFAWRAPTIPMPGGSAVAVPACCACCITAIWLTTAVSCAVCCMSAANCSAIAIALRGSFLASGYSDRVTGAPLPCKQQGGKTDRVSATIRFRVA